MRTLYALVIYTALITIMASCSTLETDSVLRGLMYLDHKGWGSDTTYGQTIVDPNNKTPYEDYQKTMSPNVSPYCAGLDPMYMELCR